MCYDLETVSRQNKYAGTGFVGRGLEDLLRRISNIIVHNPCYEPHTTVSFTTYAAYHVTEKVGKNDFFYTSITRPGMSPLSIKLILIRSNPAFTMSYILIWGVSGRSIFWSGVEGSSTSSPHWLLDEQISVNLVTDPCSAEVMTDHVVQYQKSSRKFSRLFRLCAVCDSY